MDDEKSPIEVLKQSAVVADLRDRHRDYYLKLAEQAAEGIRGSDQAAWTRILLAEHDNLRAALEWSLARDDVERAARVVVAVPPLDRYGPRTSRWVTRVLDRLDDLPSRLGAEVLVTANLFPRRPDPELARRAVELARTEGDPALVARALVVMGRRLVSALGGRAEAEAVLREALVEARRSGDDHVVASACVALGSHIGWEKRDDEARPLIAEGLGLYRALGDLSSVAWTAHERGWFEPELDAVRDLSQETIAIGHALDDPSLVVSGYDILHWRALDHGEYGEARAACDDGLTYARDKGDPEAVAWMCFCLAVVASQQGDFATAWACVDEAAPHRDQQSSWYTPHTRGIVALWEGTAAEAIDHFRDGLEAVRDERTILLVNSLAQIGLAAYCAGDFEAARRHLEECLDVNRRFAGDSEWTGRALMILGLVGLEDGDLEQATGYFEELGTISASYGPPWPVLRSLYLARTRRYAGDVAGAEALLAEVSDRIEEMARRADVVDMFLIESAAVALSRGDGTRAARLLGAADGYLRSIPVVRSPEGRREHRRVTDAVIRGMGRDAFDAEFAAGTSAPLADAINEVAR